MHEPREMSSGHTADLGGGVKIFLILTLSFLTSQRRGLACDRFSYLLGSPDFAILFHSNKNV